MPDQILTGTVTILTTATFGYTDIDPTEREGYIHMIERVSLSLVTDDTANTAKKIAVGGSIALPAPTSFSESDAWQSGLNFLEYPVAVTNEPVLADSMSVIVPGHSQGRFYHDEPYIIDSLRIFAEAQVAVAQDKSVIVAYRLKLSELKLTPAVQTSVLGRVYG